MKINLNKNELSDIATALMYEEMKWMRYTYNTPAHLTPEGCDRTYEDFKSLREKILSFYSND